MTTKCIPPCPSTLMDPKILLPRLNAHSSLDIPDHSASDSDIATFTERLMDDAAADIHKLDDEVASLKAENALLKLTIQQESYNTILFVSTLADILSDVSEGWGGPNYNWITFYIPLMDNIRIAKMIVEQGLENGEIPPARYSYTRYSNTYNGQPIIPAPDGPYVKIKLEEHLD